MEKIFDGRSGHYLELNQLMVCSVCMESARIVPRLHPVVFLFFQVSENDTILTVKRLVEDKLQVPVSQQRLLFRGKALSGIV